MPEVCRFFGIVIRMYFDDHAPPHFHAAHAGRAVEVDAATLEVLRGGLPPRALRIVRTWAGAHREEILANWDRLHAGLPALRIAPLD